MHDLYEKVLQVYFFLPFFPFFNLLASMQRYIPFHEFLQAAVTLSTNIVIAGDCPK
jgi:hypothetical protein